MRTTAVRFTLSLALLASSLATGCLASGSSTVRTEGRSVDCTTLDCMKAAETTEAQMLDTLGTPSRTMTASDGATIYVWTWRREERSSGQAFLLFSGKSTESYERSASVLVRNGVVQKWWIDQCGDEES